jgi:hypothetical protein
VTSAAPQGQFLRRGFLDIFCSCSIVRPAALVPTPTTGAVSCYQEGSVRKSPLTYGASSRCLPA